MLFLKAIILNYQASSIIIIINDKVREVRPIVSQEARSFKSVDLIAFGIGLREACLDMGPHESLANSREHGAYGKVWGASIQRLLGRNSWRSQQKIISGRPVEERPLSGGRRHAGGLLTERLRGVDYKYNRQGSWWLASLAIAKVVTQFRLLSLEPDPQKHLKKIRKATVATDSEVK